MENKLDTALLGKLKEKFQKKAFTQMPAGPPPNDPAAMMGGGGGAPPMDPMAAMMGGGGMPPMDPAMMGGGMPPMDPAMMGGAPPMDPAMMDPAMMGGAPPMDPAMGGAPPMDPAMMGGAPPAEAPPEEEGEDRITNKELQEQLSEITEVVYMLASKLGVTPPAEEVGGPIGEDAAGGSPDDLEALLGGGAAPPLPEGGAPPMDPAMMGGAPPMDPAMMDPAMMDPAMMGGAPPPEMPKMASEKQASTGNFIADMLLDLNRNK